MSSGRCFQSLMPFDKFNGKADLSNLDAKRRTVLLLLVCSCCVDFRCCPTAVIGNNGKRERTLRMEENPSKKRKITTLVKLKQTKML